MKLKVGFIYGGISTEHEISIISAIQAINNMNMDKYDIVPCNIFKLKLNKEQVSKKLKEFINSKVDNNFIYEYLLGKKVYSPDQIYLDENVSICKSLYDYTMMDQYNLSKYYNIRTPFEF